MTDTASKTDYPACPTVSLIEGDGIGPEITKATLRAIEAAGGTPPPYRTE